MFHPGWWSGWCEAQGVNPDRPALWPEAATAAFMAEKLRRFRLHWAWMLRLGQPAIIRQQSGRAELIRQVRRELQDALAPCPDDGPYRTHPVARRDRAAQTEVDIRAKYDVRTYPDGSREVILPPRPSHAERAAARLDPWHSITLEDALAHVEAHPGTERLAVRTVKCLVWLAREFHTGPGSPTAAGSRPIPNAAPVPGPGAPAPALLAGAATPP